MTTNREDRIMTEHAAYQHHHPALTLSLRTRTRTFGTLNLAVALRGKSCGWGRCDRPRRTFIGHHKSGRKSGRHFVELVIRRDAMTRVVWQRTLWGERR